MAHSTLVHGTVRLVAMIAMSLLGALLLNVQPAFATSPEAPDSPLQAATATLPVDSTVDAPDDSPGDMHCRSAAGDCTLRAAVMEANALPGRQEIRLEARTYTLTIPSAVGATEAATGSLRITDDVSLVGAAAATTIIDGGARCARGAGCQAVGIGRIFEVVRPVDVDISDLTIQHARISDPNFSGGGLRNDAGDVSLTRVVVADNFAAGRTGGLYNNASMRIHQSTIRGNEVPAGTRGIRGNVFAGRAAGIENTGNGRLEVTASTISGNRTAVGGGIHNVGQLVVRNSTLSENIGGAIVNIRASDAPFGTGFVFLNNVTLANNESRDRDPVQTRKREVAAGVTNRGAEALFVLQNSIIGDNRNPNGGSTDCVGTPLVSEGYNLVEDPACPVTGNDPTTKRGMDPKLGPLVNDGGSTQTKALASDSPAVNAGFPFQPGGPAAQACEGVDQRGVVRLICDLGAYELAVPIPGMLAVNSTADAVDALPGDGTCAAVDGACTLRAAIQEANRLPGRQTVSVPAGTFDLGIPGDQEDEAATGDLDVTEDLVLLGAGRTSTIVDGHRLDRIFDNRVGVDTSISGLTVRGGSAVNGGGIANSNLATLRLTRVVVQGGSATFGGGIDSQGSLLMDRVEVHDNSAGFNGGGISSGSGDQLDIRLSIIRDNSAALFGGGIDALGSTSIVDTTVAGNRADRGGGMAGPGTISRSLFNGNRATANGGGLLTVGTSDVTNVTFSANTAATGGAVSNSGTLTLTHATITQNEGGGVDQFGSGSISRLFNTIVAANDGSECRGLATTSLGGNLFGDASCTAGTEDRTGPDPRLGSLADNGGPTQTHRVRSDSPARDAALSSNLGVDQRGFRRPQGPGPDIGAFERQ